MIGACVVRCNAIDQSSLALRADGDPVCHLATCSTGGAAQIF